MHRSRSKKLQKLKIRKSDLESIWELLNRHYKIDLAPAQARAADNPASYIPIPDPPTIKVSSEGSMSTEDDSGAIFQGDVIDRQKSNSIDFRYWPSGPKKSIHVQLSEGSSDIFNSFSVSGKDTAWVDATYTELERLFEAVSPQDDLYARYRRWVTTMLAICIGWTITLLLQMVVPQSTDPAPQWALYMHARPALDIAMHIAIYYFMGIFVAAMISSWIASLWPSIEFDFGPEHLKSQKSKRARLGVVVVLVIAPFMLTLFQRVVLGWK